MLKKYSLKLKKQLSQLLRSMAETLESDSSDRRNRKLEQPPQPEILDSDRGSTSLLTRPPQVSPQTQLDSRRVKLAAAVRSLKAGYQKVLQPVSGKLPMRQHPQFWLRLGVGVGIGSGAIALGWVVYQLEKDIPQSVAETLTYARAETITIKGSDATVLQEIGPVTHEKVKIWQVPDPVIQAFIASEDRRFEEHGGVDFQGILRATLSNLQAGKVVEGGSTITQQLARIVFLNQERNFGRKYKEMRVAQKLEKEYDKSQILERYLNLVYLGSGAYGIADAAWVYFSKPLEDLTVAESATLAGIVPAPSLYSPLENKEAAEQRRNLVLIAMQEQGFITPQEAQEAIKSPLTVNPSKPKRLERQAPYFTDYIQKELTKYVSAEDLKAGGIIVETTLNSTWQKAAEETIERTVSRYGRWQRFQQGALVAIDPRNGQIKAMVGGNDFEKNQYNRVTQAQRQPGSTFKMFVYATAIAAGFSPNRGFLDAEYVVDGYKPENYGDKYSGAYVSMRNALASSLNVVAVRILVDVGWNPIVEVAKKMGIESKLQPTYSLALGASEVNLLELTSAYGTLANQGVRQVPYGISRIVDRTGKVLYQAKFEGKEALDPESSAIATWMLQGVVTSGTGQPAQIGRPVAGKTGTSDKSRDLWFVGYIPQLVTGVWLGNDDNQPTWGASSMAAATWRRFMLTATEDMPIESFADRPSQLDGRKGTIKAEPIKPKHSYYKKPQHPIESAQTSSGSSQGRQTTQTTTRSSARRRSSASSTSQSAPVRRRASSTPSRTVTRRSQPAPAPSPAAKPPAQAASAPAPAPAPPAASQSVAPPPAPDFIPPAPPASRKEE